MPGAPGLDQGSALVMDVPLELVRVLPEGPPLQGVGVGMVGELVTLSTYRVCMTVMCTHTYSQTMSLQGATYTLTNIHTITHTQLQNTD